MTPRRPPAARRAGAWASAFRSAPGSSLTAMRTAWNVRVATCRRRGHAARGTAPRTAATRSPVRVRGAPEPVEARGRQGHALAERRQTLERLRERRGIRVQPEEAHGVAAGAHDRLGVAAHARRPIDHPTLVARSEEKHDLVDQHRNVNRYTPRPDNLSNSVGSRSARVRSYSSNRPRSHTSNWGSPPPTSVTSFESPA